MSQYICYYLDKINIHENIQEISTLTCKYWYNKTIIPKLPFNSSPSPFNPFLSHLVHLRHPLIPSYYPLMSLHKPINALRLIFNHLNVPPEYTRGQKMSPCRGPRVYSGAESFFSIFVCKINVASIIMGTTLFLLIKVCFPFDCAWIAPHNDIWADVELSFLKESFGTKNTKWPPIKLS